MKWTSIKLHLLPLIMQEIEVCEKNYIDLINQIKAKKTKKLIDEFLEMRLDISKRIEELEDYFDENFGNIRMNILEKGIFQLKKLLFYNPDKKNDQEEEDLPEFTGLVLDFNLIEKNNIANQNFAKNMRQSNIKTAQDIKMRATMRATMRASKFPQNLRKTKIDGSSIRDTGINSGFNNRLRATSINIKEKDEIIENDNLEENNINDENNLEMYSKESINNDDNNIINEDKNIEENNDEKNDNNININSQSKDENIEQVPSNETEEDKLINNQFSNNQMINEKNEKEKIVTKIENEVKNEQREEEEIIKGNDVNINIDEQSQINETQKNKSLKKIINSIILKENNNILKKYLFKWSEKISDINLNEENELINKSEDDKEEIKSENEIENKNEKRNMINIKTLFLDEVDDEEKCVIMEEMVFRFRTLLMLSCFKNEEDLSD